MKNVKKRIHYILMLLVVCLSGTSAALAATVSGTVVDDTGEALIGVSVRLEGSKLGVVTNIDGEYVLNVPDLAKAVLTFSYTGMKNRSKSMAARWST